jgi:hypothetical protein
MDRPAIGYDGAHGRGWCAFRDVLEGAIGGSAL